jgi:hypothetical protein
MSCFKYIFSEDMDQILIHNISVFYVRVLRKNVSVSHTLCNRRHVYMYTAVYVYYFCLFLCDGSNFDPSILKFLNIDHND